MQKRFAALLLALILSVNLMPFALAESVLNADSQPPETSAIQGELPVQEPEVPIEEAPSVSPDATATPPGVSSPETETPSASTGDLPDDTQAPPADSNAPVASEPIFPEKVEEPVQPYNLPAATPVLAISSIDVAGQQVTVNVAPGVTLAAEAYSFNGGWSWQASNTYKADSKGQTFGVSGIQIRDASGNIAYNSAPVVVGPDLQAPTFSVVVSGATVTVTASDNGSGLAAEAYSFNGGWTWQKSNTYTVTEAKTWVAGTIVVRDVAGNLEYNRAEIHAAPVKDTTPPTIKIAVNGATVTVTASDNGSGLAAEAYSFNGGWGWQKSNTYTVTGNYEWVAGTIMVRDAAGNVNYNRTSVKVGDVTPPVIEITTSGQTVTVIATDDVKLHATAYSFNGGWTWQAKNTYTASSSQTWAPGTIVVRDAAGNISYNTNGISVGDKKAPVIHTIYADPSGDAPRKTLYVTASDETGLAKEAYSFNGGWTWQASNNILVEQTNTWVAGTILVRDAAGNVSYNTAPVTVKVTADVKPPEVAISVSGGGRYTTSKTITISANDDGWLAAEAYSFNGGWTWQKEPQATLTKSQTFPAGTICVKDKAGNIGYNYLAVYVGQMLEISSPGFSSSITVVEDIDGGSGYPPKSFSFDGGTNWQTSPTFTVKANRTWPIGTILAKDDLGNVNYNGEEVTVKVASGLTIDVSAHQGYIDWQKVKQSGVDYAIIRALTWSGGASGGYVEDAFFDYNVKHAKSAGIKVGAYIYSYAFNTSEINAEVNAFLSAANRLKSQGYTFDLPVFVDYEYNPILQVVPSVTERTNLLRYEMTLLNQNGYYPGMYMSTSWAQSYVGAAQLQSEGYDLWIADYRGYNGWGDSVVMWQYTSKGSVPGISGNVDMNHLYKDYSKVISGSNNAGTVPGSSSFTVFDQATNTNKTDTMLSLLAAIVNNEVGGTALTGKDKSELFKAQAIAAHSWLLYQYENFNTLPSVKLKYSGNYETIKTLITDVADKVVLYDGRPANTVYTSCNSGWTNSAENYWGKAVPYLVTTDSIYDKTYAAQYQNRARTFNRLEMLTELRKIFGNSFTTSLPEAEWIKVTGVNNYYVTGISVCGQVISPSAFTEKTSLVASPNFTVSYKNGIWTFTSNGNGHCVGMSQYGAMGYIAQAGYDHAKVLAHYYPYTTLGIMK